MNEDKVTWQDLDLDEQEKYCLMMMRMFINPITGVLKNEEAFNLWLNRTIDIREKMSYQ